MVNQEILELCQAMWDEGDVHEVRLKGEGTLALIYDVVFKVPSPPPDDSPAYFLMELEGDLDSDLVLEAEELVQVYPKKIEVQVWEKFRNVEEDAK